MEILDIDRGGEELKGALEQRSAARDYKLPWLEGVHTIKDKKTLVEAIDGGYRLYNTTPVFWPSFSWPTEFVADIIFIGVEGFIRFRTTRSALAVNVFIAVISLFAVMSFLLMPRDRALVLIFLIPGILLFYVRARRKQRFRQMILEYLRSI